MAHGDALEGKWRRNWLMEWVASTVHTTSEHGVSSITTAVAHTSAASSRLNWRPRRFKWTRPFRRKTTKSGFCACAITFQLTSIIICRLLKLTLSEQAQISLQLRVSLSHLAYRFLAGSPLLGSRFFFFFLLGPELAVDGPGLMPDTESEDAVERKR
jgi:amino acid transporter